MPGNQGGSNWGSTAGNPTDGSVYVIGFNVPTIIRLLKPGEMRAGRARRRRRRVVTEGRYVTEGFGLYPTIVNPPYTTLTAYDLNRGHDQVADWARRRSASRRSRRDRDGHGGDDQGRDHPHRHGTVVRHGR